jgi:hypothetical protein
MQDNEFTGKGCGRDAAGVLQRTQEPKEDAYGVSLLE